MHGQNHIKLVKGCYHLREGVVLGVKERGEWLSECKLGVMSWKDISSSSIKRK